MDWSEINPEDQDPPLPPNYKPVLVRMVHAEWGDEQYSVQQYADVEQCFSGETYGKGGWTVTHWMPLPEPPEHENRNSSDVERED